MIENKLNFGFVLRMGKTSKKFCFVAFLESINGLYLLARDLPHSLLNSFLVGPCPFYENPRRHLINYPCDY